MKLKALFLSLTLLVGCSKSSNFVIALGGEGVPVGAYSKKILEFYQVSEEELAKRGHITYGDDVKAVTSKVKENLVDAGIIYKTDAFSAGLEVKDVATAEMCGQVIYPAAAIKNSNGVESQAKAFLTYLTNKEAMDVFASVGFVSASEAVSEVTFDTTTELKIFAAASMTETMNQIKTKYETAHPNATLTITFGSSGALLKKIKEGPNTCDIFISAAEKQMNDLEAASLVVENSRLKLLENKVCLVTSSKNKEEIKSFEDLGKLLKKLAQ